MVCVRGANEAVGGLAEVVHCCCTQQAPRASAGHMHTHATEQGRNGTTPTPGVTIRAKQPRDGANKA
eukprot:NODE_4793_length_552_cov_64.411531_g3505_i0.p3 GENE.NODE_4793_length_552_cov_64.411531_g3505_i0~~NODE_4793_length_552_cov_64.411531_g3505_i0.p3  ORF type:complete len:67 (-),score=10.63 NODE_4793_length_552_cov_64.411531_g3505_i0:169-369(-)